MRSLRLSARRQSQDPNPGCLASKPCDAPLWKSTFQRQKSSRSPHSSLGPFLSRFSVKRSPTSPPGKDKICISGIFSAQNYHPAPRLHLLPPSWQPWQPVHGALSVHSCQLCVHAYRATRETSSGQCLKSLRGPAIPPLGIYTPQNRKQGAERVICIPVFITALFPIAQRWKQTQCPPPQPPPHPHPRMKGRTKCGPSIHWNISQPHEE